jgi:hypothetical protein
MRTSTYGAIFLACLAWSAQAAAATPAGCTTPSIDGKKIIECKDQEYRQPQATVCPQRADANKFDLYLPTTHDAQSQIKFPLVIWVHGGSWGGDKSANSDLAMRIAARGHVVANINYRTTCGASGWPNPQMLADVQDFAAFARAELAADYRIDTAKISIGGTSAGAQLALMEATQGARLYRNVFVGSSPTRLDTIFDEGPRYQAGKDTVRLVFVEPKTVQEAMGTLASNSPYNRIAYLWTEGLYMEYSSGDNLVPYTHSTQFVTAARMRGIPVFDQGYSKVCVVDNDHPADHCMPDPPPGLGLLEFIDRNGGTLSSAAAKMELAGWPASNVVDGEQASVYSSPLADRYNSAGHFLAAWSNLRRTNTPGASADPIWVDTLIMRARVTAGGQPLGFPKSYSVYVTNPGNSAWVLVGLRQTHGLLLVPSELGQDDFGNYYLQMADLHLQRM